MLRKTKIFIVDEASCINKQQLKFIDTKLRILMGNDEPFGGKVIVLGGDFRQTLPIIQNSGENEIIENTIKNS